MSDEVCGHPCADYFEIGSCKCTGYKSRFVDDSDDDVDLDDFDDNDDTPPGAMRVWISLGYSFDDDDEDDWDNDEDDFDSGPIDPADMADEPVQEQG